ncbi:hypothetical protein [Ruegeria hyattellae]|uniref:hypothetical protein n=1 Tax=Ruegeria hyattellae TaxID=3233337 RepID=UPI00355BF39A
MSAIPTPQTKPEMQRPGDLGFDPFETGILSVTRHLLVSFRSPETQTWHIAYSIAAERWGDNIGFPAAHRLAKYLKAVLRSRTDSIDFNDPFCVESRDWVTQDEAALLYVLHFMRRDDTPAARDAVETLTLGRMDPDVIRTGLDFAQRFPSGATPAPQHRTKPVLYVVS